MGKGLKHDKRGAALAALLAGGSLGALVVATAPPAFAQNEAAVEFDIPTQPIAEALVEYARQARVQFVMTVPPPSGLNGNAVRGALRREAALAQLLAGTGYEGEFRGGSFYVRRIDDTPERVRGRRAEEGSGALVQLAQASTHGDARLDVATGGGGEDARAADEEEIIVVGTNIRGVHPDSSPVEIYTAEDIERTGATTTEQFIQKLPQNLASRTQFAPGSTGQPNREGVNAIDLRGLGVGTTLVLLNGRRLPLASGGRAADISLLPLSSIARVEVLTDGASAIYGSDAIGGVVNFVTRDNLHGQETRVTYGSVTEGGMRQGGVSQAIGRRWRDGHAIVSYDFMSASALHREDRSYTLAGGPGQLSPTEQRNGLLASATQDFGSAFEVSADLGVSFRDVKNEYAGSNFVDFGEFNRVRSESSQYFANIGARYRITENADASLTATYSEIDSEIRGAASYPVLNLVVPSSFDANYSVFDLTGMVSGDLFELPGGTVRTSLGGGFTTEEFRSVLTPRVLGRETSYLFGELLIPVISEDQRVPLVRRMAFSVAARYTEYEDSSSPALDQDFGGKTNPKIGIIWSPIMGVNLRGTYGSSFRAASLLELDPTLSGINSIAAIPIGGVVTPLIGVRGPRNLDPEFADSWTAGFDVVGGDAARFRLSGTYFNIDYSDRIGIPDPGGLSLVSPNQYPDVIIRSPTPAFVESLLRSTRNVGSSFPINLSDPTAAAIQLTSLPGFVVFDNRLTNLARSQVDGFDISASMDVRPSWGDLELGLQVTRILEYRQQATPASPNQSVVDTVLLPVDLRARLFANFARGPVSGSLSANYVDDYRNPFATGGAAEVDSWITVDSVVSYSLERGDSTPVRLSLSVQNLFDEAPPFVGGSGTSGPALQNPVGFDPANANPLGRFVAAGITISW